MEEGWCDVPLGTQVWEVWPHTQGKHGSSHMVWAGEYIGGEKKMPSTSTHGMVGRCDRRELTHVRYMKGHELWGAWIGRCRGIEGHTCMRGIKGGLGGVRGRSRGGVKGGVRGGVHTCIREGWRWGGGGNGSSPLHSLSMHEGGSGDHIPSEAHLMVSGPPERE